MQSLSRYSTHHSVQNTIGNSPFRTATHFSRLPCFRSPIQPATEERYTGIRMTSPVQPAPTSYAQGGLHYSSLAEQVDTSLSLSKSISSRGYTTISFTRKIALVILRNTSPGFLTFFFMLYVLFFCFKFRNHETPAPSLRNSECRYEVVLFR